MWRCAACLAWAGRSCSLLAEVRVLGNSSARAAALAACIPRGALPGGLLCARDSCQRARSCGRGSYAGQRPWIAEERGWILSSGPDLSTSWQPAHVSGVCLEPMALPFGQTASYVRRDVAKLPKPCTRLGLPRRRDQFVERPGRLSCSAASAQCRREGLVRGLQTLSSATARPSGLVKPAPWHCHGIA